MNTITLIPKLVIAAGMDHASIEHTAPHEADAVIVLIIIAAIAIVWAFLAKREDDDYND